MHTEYMKQALALAAEGLGRTAPNPTVGCVIVKDGEVIARARTADGGRPHGESIALDSAGDKAKGATLYVTLEPCAHYGQTAPCAQKLIDAGVACVVVACQDANPRVTGKGIKMLQDAGIEVITDICKAEAQYQNKGFFMRFTENRPWITLKMAISKNGMIAEAGGQPAKISCSESLNHMHTTLRATHDAILVGMGTVIHDDPRLTARDAAGNDIHYPARIVLGNSLSMPDHPHLQDDIDEAPLLTYNSHDLHEVLDDLVHNHGLTRILVEGGARVMGAFIGAGLWDEAYLYQCPTEVSADGIEAPDFSSLKPYLKETQEIGPDRLEIYRRQA